MLLAYGVSPLVQAAAEHSSESWCSNPSDESTTAILRRPCRAACLTAADGRTLAGMMQNASQMQVTNSKVCRERGEAVPPDMSLDVARRIKERYCYIASDIAKVGQQPAGRLAGRRHQEYS